MSASDARILMQMLRGQSRSGSHAERLQAFYAPQAERYDAFRERLLHGRQDLVERLAPANGADVVELGGGTGRNLAYFGERLAGFNSVTLVDLCPALLQQACKRVDGMPNVRVVEADATSWQPEEPVDCVYFSYSLTMIPGWRRAIDNALAILKPDGRLGVVDFYVSSAAPESGLVRHGVFDRAFWPRWFGHDGVHLNPEHLHYLRACLPNHELEEMRASVPYLPGLRVPYYVFVGRLN